jgi:hypothetical protein
LGEGREGDSEDGRKQQRTTLRMGELIIPKCSFSFITEFITSSVHSLDLKLLIRMVLIHSIYCQ